MSDEPPRKAGWLRWARNVVLAILATLSLAIGLTQTSWGRARIRELTVTVIRDELGLDASFGELRVDLGLLPPRIEVVASEIALVDPVYGRLVKARRLVISPSVGALLRGELDLDEILIDGAVVNLIVREGEVRNLHVALEAASLAPTEKCSLPMASSEMSTPVSGSRLTAARSDWMSRRWSP